MLLFILNIKLSGIDDCRALVLWGKPQNPAFTRYHRPFPTVPALTHLAHISICHTITSAAFVDANMSSMLSRLEAQGLDLHSECPQLLNQSGQFCSWCDILTIQNLWIHTTYGRLSVCDEALHVS